MRTVVTFESDAFNTDEPRDYFINECCYGDDVAQAIIEQLQFSGLRCEPEPDQEDFGWYLTFEAQGSHQLVLGYRPDTDQSGTWIGWVERNEGILGSILGRRRRAVQTAAALAVHEALVAMPSIRNVRWHTTKAFDTGHEEEGVPSPTAA
jgi:hypothetical protein